MIPISNTKATTSCISIKEISQGTLRCVPWSWLPLAALLLLCSYSKIPKQLNADVINHEWEFPLLRRSFFSGQKQCHYCIGKQESNGACSLFVLALCDGSILFCLHVSTCIFFLTLLAGTQFQHKVACQVENTSCSLGMLLDQEGLFINTKWDWK